MKKIFLIILFISIFLYLLFTYSDNFKAKIITSYSNSYNESLFNHKLIGISESELLSKLGKPIKITENLEGYESFLYTKDLDKIDIANGYIGVTFKDEDWENQDEVAFSLITFNKDNKCISQWKTLSYKDSIDLSGKKKQDVIKIYGLPNRKMKCNGDYKVYKFSELNTNITENDSSYQINVRLVYIDKNNKVVKFYKDINFDNNEYLGCCWYE